MAGIRYDLIDPKYRDNAAPDAPVDESSGFLGEAIKGLDASTTGLGGGLRAVAGTAGEALGFNDFAQDQYKQARAAGLRAQSEGPRISSYKQVVDPGGNTMGTLRNARDYVGGLIGGSLPSMAVGTGAALATGGALVPAMLASTAAQIPIEASDVAMKQLEDPQAMAMPATERGLRQLGGGAASAALQSVVPAIVGGKLLGKGAAMASKQSLKQVAMSNAAAIPVEGVLEGGGEAVKQLATNENKPFDTDAIWENVIGGGAVGGAFAGAGFAGDVANSRMLNAKNSVTGAVDKVAPGLSSAYDSVKDTTDSVLGAMKSGYDENAPQSLKDGVEFLKGKVDDRVAQSVTWLNEIKNSEDVPAAIKAQAVEYGKTLGNRSSQAFLWATNQSMTGAAVNTTSDVLGTAQKAGKSAVDYLRGFNKPNEDAELDRIVAGKPLGDLDEFNAATPETQRSIVEQGFARTGEIVSNTISRLSQRMDLTDAQRASLATAQQNVGDAASAMSVSTIAKAVKAKDAVMSRLSALVDGVKRGASENPNVKKSEQYDGIRTAISETIAPLLASNHQEFLSNPSMMQMLGDGLRGFVKQAADGDNAGMQRFSTDLARILGPNDAHEILDSLSYMATGGDAKKMASYVKMMQLTLDQDADNAPLTSVIDAYKKEGSQGDSKDLADQLVSWHNGDLDRGKTPERIRLNDTMLNRQLIAEFGPEGATKILAATEASAKAMQSKLKKDTTFDSGAASDMDDGGFEDAYEQRTQERDVRGAYVANDGSLMANEDKSLPKLYPHPDSEGKSGFANATKQAIDKMNIKDPGTRVYYVPLRDYAKARDWSEAQIQAELVRSTENGRPVPDVSSVGFLKTEKIQSDDGLKDYQLKAMQMQGNFARKSTGSGFVDTPSVLRVVKDGRPMSAAYDSTKVARVMSDASKSEWSAMENSAGWSSRLASKFAEGVAALMEHHGGTITPRDDQVIGYVEGEPLTWGEGQKLIKGYKSVKDEPGSLNERKAREFVPELDDQTLKSVTAKVKNSLDEKIAGFKAQLKEERVKDEAFMDRLRGFMADENSGVPALKRMQSALESEAKKRASETRRAELLGSGEETREGFKVNNMAVAALEGATKAAAAHTKKLKTATEFFDKFKKLIETEENQLQPSGRKKGDRDGNIHEAGATVNADDLVRQNTELDARPKLDMKQTKLAVTRLRKDEGNANNQKVADRLEKLLANVKMMGYNDAVELLRVNKDMTPITVAAILKPLAQKYMDRIVAPGKEVLGVGNQRPSDKGKLPEERGRPVTTPSAVPKSAAAVPKSAIAEAVAAKADPVATLARYKEYLDNPPADYTPERANQIVAWADKQVERLTQTMKSVDESSDRYNELSDMRLDARFLAKKGREITSADAVLESKLGPQGSTPSPKELAAKKAALMQAASSSDPALLKELSTTDDAKGLQRAAEALPPGAALDAANARLAVLVQDPVVAYGLQTKKYSQEDTKASAQAPGPSPISAKGMAQIATTVKAMLGSTVKLEFANQAHAGEFEKTLTDAVIRISTHALNPTTVAYHESLHAFFDQLKTAGKNDVTQVLEKAAGAPGVMNQLRKLLENEPAALKQLSDPEERAAYMFQFWANGDLKLGEKANTVFGKIAETIRKVLGIWTNEDRALHIMEHFSSGEYAKGMGDMNAVHRVLMEPGRNKSFESLHKAAKPFLDMAENVVGAGAANLRDSNIPALARIADIIKKKGTATGEDAGYLPAARLQRMAFLKQYSDLLGTSDKVLQRDALEALQTGNPASTPEARILARGIRKMLDGVFDYLHQAGVNVSDLGYQKDYFPRQWDPHYLSKNKDAFMEMARKYKSWDAEATYNKLVANDGSELQVVDKPGMSANKKRVLDFISHDDAAPFMSKNIHQILNSYITQATRRGEWARRLGDDNTKLVELYAQAKSEGATPGQMEQTKKFIAGVNGTLGDDLNPTARRLMGNMIVYQNVRLLPLAVFSMAVDPMGIMVRGGTLKDAWGAFKRGVSEIPMGMKGNTSKDAQTAFAADMGTIDNAVLQHAIGSMYTQGVTSDLARKINDGFFRFNMVEQMNTSMRVGATEAAMGFLAQHAEGKGKHSMRYLAELGLAPADIQLDPGGRVKTRVGDGLTEAQAAKMRSAVNQWVDGAVLRPDAADKPVWMNDPKFMLIAHLKQFTYAFQHTILARVAHEARNGNYTPAMALASYVPMMIAADFIKGFVQGGGDTPEWKRNWDLADYVSNGLQRAGLLGVGQIGVDVWKDVHQGGSGAGALLGPTIEQFGDAVQMLGGHKQFGPMLLRSLPANQLYAHAFGTESPDPIFAE